jgi:hypothetical protein
MPKMIRRLGSITSFRSRTPTNEQTASNFTNMVFDHSQQKEVVPDRKPKVLIEATAGISRGGYRTMNRSGQPMALGLKGVGGTRVNLGGAPDSPGTRKF